MNMNKYTYKAAAVPQDVVDLAMGRSSDELPRAKMPDGVRRHFSGPRKSCGGYQASVRCQSGPDYLLGPVRATIAEAARDHGRIVEVQEGGGGDEACQQVIEELASRTSDVARLPNGVRKVHPSGYKATLCRGDRPELFLAGPVRQTLQERV